MKAACTVLAQKIALNHLLILEACKIKSFSPTSPKINFDWHKNTPSRMHRELVEFGSLSIFFQSVLERVQSRLHHLVLNARNVFGLLHLKLVIVSAISCLHDTPLVNDDMDES